MLVKGNASLTIGAKKIGKISGCTLEYSREMIEQTEIGRANKTTLAGIRSWSISGEGTAEFNPESGHAELVKALNDGTEIQVSFTTDDSYIFSGKGFLTSLSVDMSSGELASIGFEIAGSGELSHKVKEA